MLDISNYIDEFLIDNRPTESKKFADLLPIKIIFPSQDVHKKGNLHSRAFFVAKNCLAIMTIAIFHDKRAYRNNHYIQGGP